MTKIVSRIWIRAILAAAVAYHTLWACSPVAQMPPGSHAIDITAQGFQPFRLAVRV